MLKDVRQILTISPVGILRRANSLRETPRRLLNIERSRLQQGQKLERPRTDNNHRNHFQGANESQWLARVVVDAHYYFRRTWQVDKGMHASHSNL